MPLKSKYDLESYAPLKIPKYMYFKLKDIFGDSWTDKARDAIYELILKEERKE